MANTLGATTVFVVGFALLGLAGPGTQAEPRLMVSSSLLVFCTDNGFARTDGQIVGVLQGIEVHRTDGFTVGREHTDSMTGCSIRGMGDDDAAAC